jgi:branched-chain amino acid transport system substrate-binding protein
MPLNIRRGFKFSSFIILIAVTLFVLSPWEAKAADTVKIGIVDVFSGPFNNWGKAVFNGIKFVVDEQNAKGGLLGKKIELIKEDTELKPDVALRRAKKLLLEDNVDILGIGTGSNVAIACNRLAASNKKLFLQYAASADNLTGNEFNRNSFRIGHATYPYVRALTRLMATTPYKKYYLLNMDYAAGRDFSRDFKKYLKMEMPDAEIVGDDFHPLNNKDFAPYINKIINSKADAIATYNWGVDLTLMVKQARSLGLKAPFPIVSVFGGDPVAINEMKEEMVGVHLALLYDMRVNTPENQAMIKKFNAQHKNDDDFDFWWPKGNTGMAISGWKMAFAAIEKAGSMDVEKIIPAFEGFSYKTPVGMWTMRACDHQVIYPLYGGKIEAGPNPYYKFPWLGSDLKVFPGNEMAIPATAEYNPRCK